MPIKETGKILHLFNIWKFWVYEHAGLFCCRNIFGKLNDYPQLDTIDMTNNKIEEIKGKTYHHVGNVKTLILNHNNLNITGDKTHPRIFSNFVNLESLHLTNAFTESVDSKDYLVALEQIFVGSNLTSLIKVHLEQNEIWHFKNPKMFCNLPSLMDLYLGDNNLTDINFDFSCLRNLRFLDLRDNRINTLSNYTLNKFADLPNEGAGVKFDLLVMDQPAISLARILIDRGIFSGRSFYREIRSTATATSPTC